MGTRIDWTDLTWNPMTGCTPISAGCENCYAKRFAKRLKIMNTPGYEREFEPTYHPNKLHLPYKWGGNKRIFVCSMSDLFHGDFTLEQIRTVIDTMRNNENHTFQILTKRASRIEQVVKYVGGLPRNVWLGVTVENNESLKRVKKLHMAGYHQIKFVSFEPLLERIDLNGVFPSDLHCIVDWVIVGGETGQNARKMELSWAREIRDYCKKHGVPFFFKQTGGKNSSKQLDGETYHEFPR